MMTKIDRILRTDEETFKIFNDYDQLILGLIKESKVPKTTQAMYILVGKIMLVKNAVLDLRETENLYSINILYRSLIEHFLKFMYVFMRAAEKKDDSIGEDYLHTLLLKEQFDIGKSYSKVSRILGKERKAQWEDLNDLKLNPKNLSAKFVEGKAKEFSYTYMIEYIDQRINKLKEFETNFLLKVIPKYADLSSFVHGGPLSDKILTDILFKDGIDTAIENLADLAFNMFHVSVHYSFLYFYQHDKRFDKPYLQLEILMKAFSKANQKANSDSSQSFQDPS